MGLRYSSGCFNSQSMGLPLTQRIGASSTSKKGAAVAGNPSLRAPSSALVLIVPRLSIAGTTSYLSFRRGTQAPKANLVESASITTQLEV
jgi:hypothetical protein